MLMLEAFFLIAYNLGEVLFFFLYLEEPYDKSNWWRACLTCPALCWEHCQTLGSSTESNAENYYPMPSGFCSVPGHPTFGQIEWAFDCRPSQNFKRKGANVNIVNSQGKCSVIGEQWREQLIVIIFYRGLTVINFIFYLIHN